VGPQRETFEARVHETLANAVRRIHTLPPLPPRRSRTSSTKETEALGDGLDALICSAGVFGGRYVQADKRNLRHSSSGYRLLIGKRDSGCEGELRDQGGGPNRGYGVVRATSQLCLGIHVVYREACRTAALV